MASGGKIDWRGLEDGTPPSNPKAPLDDAPDPAKSSGDSWKGIDDATPPSKPTTPDKA
jgi:hypothetical protein